jgi:hypothetical protein
LQSLSFRGVPLSAPLSAPSSIGTSRTETGIGIGNHKSAGISLHYPLLSVALCEILPLILPLLVFARARTRLRVQQYSQKINLFPACC